MISVSRPGTSRIEAVRRASESDLPTIDLMTAAPHLARDLVNRAVGTGWDDFAIAREGLRQWAAHRAANIAVYPVRAPIAMGVSVVLVTRQMGVWVTAACRIVDVEDDPNRFGFTYATLPDHPERGWESFAVELHQSEVRFTIEAVSEPSLVAARLLAPLVRSVQRRITARYLDGLERWVDVRR